MWRASSEPTVWLILKPRQQAHQLRFEGLPGAAGHGQTLATLGAGQQEADQLGLGTPTEATSRPGLQQGRMRAVSGFESIHAFP
jgi:hypothetical protein